MTGSGKKGMAMIWFPREKGKWTSLLTEKGSNCLNFKEKEP